jgi:hypothetical protein
MYILGPSGATSRLVAAKSNDGSPALQCQGTCTVLIYHVPSNVMARSICGRLTMLKSFGTLTFRAGSSLFTDEIQHHDISEVSQENYAAPSGLVPCHR